MCLSLISVDSECDYLIVGIDGGRFLLNNVRCQVFGLLLHCDFCANVTKIQNKSLKISKEFIKN